MTRVLSVCTDSNVWSLALALGLLVPALYLTATLASKHPSKLLFDQQELHCSLYNNDGAPSAHGCLAQWCSNQAHWPYAWCNMTESVTPYDPQYNADFLTTTFPYDLQNSRLAWSALGLVAGYLAAEVLVYSLQIIDPSRRVENVGFMKRYRTLVLVVSGALWLFSVATTSLLLYEAVETAAAWGLYNVPAASWTASTVLVGIMMLLHIFKRALGLGRWMYQKKVEETPAEPDAWRVSRPNQGLSRRVSGARIAEIGARALRSDVNVDNQDSFGIGTASGDLPVSSTSSEFTWDVLASATKGFDHGMIIGEGGFGKVYKGELSNGQTVAVKVLYTHDKKATIVNNHRAELEIINRVHHRNLVQLLGYCSQNDRLALVLEFMENGSLADFLGGPKRCQLDWMKRVRIAVGAARGLNYLHNDCSPRVIHRDIKASNILLDSSFEAKVADFGLARLLGDNHNHTTTRVMGTIGYLAPDYAFSGILSDRSDVYSFGVVLLELITGRKAVDVDRCGTQQSLVEWASNRPSMDEVLRCLNDCQSGSSNSNAIYRIPPSTTENDSPAMVLELDTTYSGHSHPEANRMEEMDGLVSATMNRQSSLSKIFSQLLSSATGALTMPTPELFTKDEERDEPAEAISKLGSLWDVQPRNELRPSHGRQSHE